MLNTIYLRTFLAVVDSGNYTAAAELLHMSQPAVSQHIRALEGQLGDVRLFRRMGQKMVTTHAGEELLAAARELIVMAERIEQNIRALRGQIMGQVTIGCTASSGEHLLPPLLAAFREQYTAVSLKLHITDGEGLRAALGNGDLDMLLLEEPPRRRDWDALRLGEEPIRLLARPDHPAFARNPLAADLLQQHPLILPPAGLPLRRTIEDTLRQRGVLTGQLLIALECSSSTVALQSARAGLGLAFVPASCIPGDETLVSVELADLAFQQEWYLIRERGRVLSHAAEEVRRFLSGPTAQALLFHHGLQQAALVGA